MACWRRAACKCSRESLKKYRGLPGGPCALKPKPQGGYFGSHHASFSKFVKFMCRAATFRRAYRKRRRRASRPRFSPAGPPMR